MKNTLRMILLLLLVASSAVAQDRMDFSHESPTNTMRSEEPPGYIPLVALPGSEIELNLEAAYDPATGRQMVREQFETTIAEGEIFAGRTLRLLFVDFDRFAYSTMELQGSLEADFARARAFVNQTPAAAMSDDQLQARLLSIYASRLESMADALMSRPFDDSGTMGGGGTSQGRCSMETAYALQSRDIVNIVVAETFSQVNATQGGNWRHRGYCDPRKNIEVRIPGSNIVVFTTNWHGTCNQNNDVVGPVVRTAVQGDYVNFDFPLLQIFNTVYPEQNVYARHLIRININPGTGGLQLETAYAHWGDGNPSILAAYLLHAHEAHFRSIHTCD